MNIKSCVKRVVPRPIWAKAFRLRHELFEPWRHRRENALLLEKIYPPLQLLSGPFRGLRYLHSASGSAFFPKILGTYELEIRDAVEWIVQYEPDLIVNVGCAEGYYAVGLARRCPAARCVAFDLDRRARRLTRHLARINGVENRLAIRRACYSSDLQPLCASAKKPVIVADCEGFEDALLVPGHAPALRNAVILVELHDCFCPGVSRRLAHRFRWTHESVTFYPRPRAASDLPPGVQLDGHDAETLMDEHRAARCANEWFLMVPRGLGHKSIFPPSPHPRRAA